MQEIDPSLEKDLMEYQNLEKQIQLVILQKHQLQMQINEINLALEELSKINGEVYRSIGGIIIKSSKEEAEKDLREKKEIYTIRINALSQQEEKLKNSLIKLQKRIETLAPKEHEHH